MFQGSAAQMVDAAFRHLGAGRLQQAESLCRQALMVDPFNAPALHIRGLIASDMGRNDIAVALFREALAINPRYAEVHGDLGLVLKSLGRPDEAIASYERAIQLRPDLAILQVNLGMALADLARFDEATAAFHRAIDVDPRDIRAGDALLMTMLYDPHLQPAALRAELRAWDQRHAKSLAPSPPSFANDPSPERRLRVGYVSADFCNHACAYFIIPLLTNHDRRHFEIVCYANVPRPDAITRRMREHADLWRETTSLSDAALADQVRRDAIDLLVDLKLHTKGNRLLVFARKPAPVQIAWLGYPGSSGLSAMDYRITDPYLESDVARETVEEPLCLAGMYWAYDPLCSQPDVNTLPASTNGFVTFGCLNNFVKINDEILTLWGRVLQNVAGSRLLLLSPQSSRRTRILEILGVESDRVEFAGRRPRSAYLELYHRIDLCLDTWPYNGHTTSLDSLWMGVPVVTLDGPMPASRVGLTHLSHLGLPELVAHNPEEFVRIAIELAHDHRRLAELRATLRERMNASPLMDGPGFARNMETAYRRAWRRWCQGNASAPRVPR